MSTAGSDKINILRKIRNAKGLSRQQVKTLRGQVLSGDVDGAEKGLEKILRRKE